MAGQFSTDDKFLPDFLIIGAMKSGTTGLYDDLATHPGAFLPRVKEPDILYKATTSGGIHRLYRKHFKGALNSHIIAEASTAYTKMPEYPDISAFARMSLGSKVKIVYAVRDPVSRIVSHLSHDYLSGKIQDHDFDTLVFEDPKYLAFSDYATQLIPWINTFGLKNILCISFKDYVTNRFEQVRKVASFVGLDPDQLQYRSEISNPRENTRISRSRYIDNFIASDTYRSGIACVIPRSVLDVIKRTLTYNRKMPSIDLSSQTTDYIQSKFVDLSDRLEELGVGKLNW